MPRRVWHDKTERILTRSIPELSMMRTMSSVISLLVGTSEVPNSIRLRAVIDTGILGS